MKDEIKQLIVTLALIMCVVFSFLFIFVLQLDKRAETENFRIVQENFQEQLKSCESSNKYYVRENFKLRLKLEGACETK